MPVNLSLVYPSSVGLYAACSQRLVYDSIHGKPYSAGAEADFGTICHYFTQYALGVAPLHKEPTDEQFSNARTLFSGRSEDLMMKAVDKCVKAAVKALPKLQPGVSWVAEVKAYDKTILPTRVGRKGDVCGYGGDVDLMPSDRSSIWDLKFVGAPPTKIKLEYLWQLGSYHITTKIPVTGILFVTRDARNTSTATIDWRRPAFAELAKSMRATIDRMGHENFERYAFPLAGEHCKYCNHKAICPVQRVPPVEAFMDVAVPNIDDSLLETMMASADPALLG